MALLGHAETLGRGVTLYQVFAADPPSDGGGSGA
jgi:hypothetical protein